VVNIEIVGHTETVANRHPKCHTKLYFVSSTEHLVEEEFMSNHLVYALYLVCTLNLSKYHMIGFFHDSLSFTLACRGYLLTEL